MERILGRTVGGRVILDLDVIEMVRSSAKRSEVMIDAGTPMVRRRRVDRASCGGQTKKVPAL